MNYCRTCKHWSKDPNFIGAGNCVNLEVRLKLKIWGNDQGLVTAQNFGCVCHETGEPTARLLSTDQERELLNDFLSEIKP